MTPALHTAPAATAFLSSDADAWAGAARLTFRAGEEIYAQDENADLIYRLVSGAVRTSHLLADGRRQIGDFYYEGDVLGVEIGSSHRFSAEALGECEVLAIRRAGSAAYDPGRIERLIWQATAAELGRAQSHMLLLGRTTACEKVARFLLDIADRFRGDQVALPMSRQDMAD
jgi:CRP/FNR family nitrogen fixation transcriptional regulator